MDMFWNHTIPQLGQQCLVYSWHTCVYVRAFFVGVAVKPSGRAIFHNILNFTTLLSFSLEALLLKQKH